MFTFLLRLAILLLYLCAAASVALMFEAGRTLLHLSPNGETNRLEALFIITTSPGLAISFVLFARFLQREQ